MERIRTYDNLRVYANVPLAVEMAKAQTGQDIFEYDFSFKWDLAAAQADEKSEIKLEWDLPGLDVHYYWHPNVGTRRIFQGEWSQSHTNMMTVSAPVAAMFSGHDLNAATIATDEVMRVNSVHLGGQDTDNILVARVKLPLKQYTGKDSHRMKARLDLRRVPLYEALGDVAAWWEKALPGSPMEVPEAAKMPMYSSWYAYHKDIRADELEEQCRLAKQMGMDTIIVDDGWQTGVNSGAYGYTGDWQVWPGKIPDMAVHVRKVHEAGLKYMLWYSVPFIGHFAKGWEKYKDKILYDVPRLNCAVLDPRYPEVREFLIGTYVRAVEEWDLDGFKLDFIDSFVAQGDAPVKQGMDFTCVQEATRALMLGVVSALKKIKEDILIEFRQSYIGPMMRQFGNMFRVGDCASDIASNRIGTIDLRMLSGNTAVHSDMLSWSHDETPEDAALQILHSIFGVIQFSQIITDMPESHRRMSAFWLGFARKNKKVLLESELIPYEPQYLYPVVKAQDDMHAIVGVYQRGKIADLPDRQKVSFINASREETLYIRCGEGRRAKATVRNTLGEIVREEEIVFSGITPVSVPNSGLLELVF